MVPQSHTVPQKTTVTRLIRLTVSILTDDILNCVKFTATVICIYYYLLSSEDLLLSSIHEMILVHSVLLPLAIRLLLMLTARAA